MIKKSSAASKKLRKDFLLRHLTWESLEKSFSGKNIFLWNLERKSPLNGRLFILDYTLPSLSSFCPNQHSLQDGGIRNYHTWNMDQKTYIVQIASFLVKNFTLSCKPFHAEKSRIQIARRHTLFWIYSLDLFLSEIILVIGIRIDYLCRCYITFFSLFCMCSVLNLFSVNLLILHYFLKVEYCLTRIECCCGIKAS